MSSNLIGSILKMKNYLFVCTFNQQRSPTAEEVCTHILKQKKLQGNVKSAGTNNDAINKISLELIKWADRIFVMEQHHKEVILKIDPKSKNKIMVLNIKDIFLRDDPLLVRIIKEKLEKEI